MKWINRFSWFLSIIFISAIILQITGVPLDNEVDPRYASTITSENLPWNGEKYFFQYETSTGLVRFEEGFNDTNSKGETFVSKIGFFTTINVEGKLAVVEYFSDDTGHHQFSAKPVEDYPNEYLTRLGRHVMNTGGNSAMKALLGNMVSDKKMGPICMMIKCYSILERMRNAQQMNKKNA